ncbi:MAG: AfsR/SARP family transcriptional regulator, partial [Stackebrandtia sp.]
MNGVASRNMTKPVETTVPASAGTVFRLLGPLEVICRGAVRDVPAGRQQALLTALLLRPNETVPAPTLVAQVWGEGANRSVLNVCVMRLRRSLQDRDHDLVRAEGAGYRIAVDESAVDLHRF